MEINLPELAAKGQTRVRFFWSKDFFFRSSSPREREREGGGELAAKGRQELCKTHCCGQKHLCLDVTNPLRSCNASEMERELQSFRSLGLDLKGWKSQRSGAFMASKFKDSNLQGFRAPRAHNPEH